MGAGKKLSMVGDDDLFNDLLKVKPEPKAKPEPVVPQKSTRKAMVLRMSEDMKDSLERYCRKNDMTITAGIKKAIREMLEAETR